MTTRADFEYKRSETVVIRVSLHKSDETILPIGDSAIVQFRLAKGNNLYFLLNKADMILESDGNTGVVRVVLTTTMMDAAGMPLRSTRYRYEFHYSDPILGESVQLEGVLKLKRSLRTDLPTMAVA